MAAAKKMEEVFVKKNNTQHRQLHDVFKTRIRWNKLADCTYSHYMIVKTLVSPGALYMHIYITTHFSWRQAVWKSSKRRFGPHIGCHSSAILISNLPEVLVGPPVRRKPSQKSNKIGNFVSSPIINTRSRLMLQRNLMSMSYMYNVYSKLSLHDVEELWDRGGVLEGTLFKEGGGQSRKYGSYIVLLLLFSNWLKSDLNKIYFGDLLFSVGCTHWVDVMRWAFSILSVLKHVAQHCL